MGNSLLDIKPHQVSRNLRGYSVLFYGTPKSGKTTIASKFPGALVLAFEKGYLAIPGIMAKPMYSWGDFKKTLRELADPAVKEAFQTIVIDTADIAYDYVSKYICYHNIFAFYVLHLYYKNLLKPYNKFHLSIFHYTNNFENYPNYIHKNQVENPNLIKY